MKKEIRILAVSDPAVYGYTDKTLNIITDYESINNVKVIFDIIEWENYYSTLIDSFISYKYDVVMVAGHLWLAEFVNKNYLKELNVSDDLEYDFSDILDIIQEEMKLNNKLYLLPSFCDGHMLAYRKDKVSIESNENISIKDIIKYLGEPKKSKTVLKAHESEIFLDFLPYLRAFGADAFDELGNPLFNNDNGIKALDYYKKMLNYSDKDTLNYGNSEVLESIQKDKVLMAVSWGGQIGQILRDNCINKDTLKFIGLKESWNVTWSFGIPSMTNKSEEALKFIKYLSSKRVDSLIGTYCGNPTRKSTFINDQEKNKWYPSLLKMLETSSPLPNLLNTGELIGIFTNEIVKFMNGEQSAKDTITKAYNNMTNVSK